MLDKRITAEMGLITLSDDKMSNSSEALLSRVASLEEKLASGSFISSSANKITPHITEEAKSNDTTVAPKAVNPQSLRQLQFWSEVIQTVERTDPGSSGHLKASKAYLDGSAVIIHVKTEFAVMLLDNPQIRTLIASGINLNDESLSITQSNIKFIVDKTVTDESDPFDSL